MATNVTAKTRPGRETATGPTQDSIRMCIDRPLPPELQAVAARAAIAENPANVPAVRFRPGLGVADVPVEEIAVLVAKQWQNGRTLRVRFLDGDPAVQARLQPYAHEWSKYANIRFEFGDDPDAEIRISFQDVGRSWSNLGTDALVVPRNEATMNYGWLTPSSAEDEYSRVVIHEFGHALGCIHEHQNPVADIPWDKEAVYRYYAGPPNFWTPDMVDFNLFRRYSATQTNFSEFDPESIMLYAISNDLTIGDFEVGWNRTLSTVDKRFIATVYPKAETAQPAPSMARGWQRESGADMQTVLEEQAPGTDQEAYLPIDSYFGSLGRTRPDPGLEENVMLPGTIQARDEDIDVAFWNIEWFNKNVERKVRGVARFIADMNLDVWALEETSPAATERLVALLRDAYGLDFGFAASEPDAPNGKQSTTVMWNRATVAGGAEAWPEEIETVLRLTSRDDLAPLEAIEEAIHGKIFDRYPGLFHLSAQANPEFGFYIVPLHLKAMDEGSLRRQLASRVLGAAVKKMIGDGADGDWILGGDVNAELGSGDFEALTSSGLTAVSAQDERDGAISYIEGPKSLIDHIFLSQNLASRFGTQHFSIVAAEKEIPNYAASISDHRPVMIRLHIAAGIEEGVGVAGLPVPEWLRV